jgi:hypothetical protein
MRIQKSQLKRIIQEEFDKLLMEQEGSGRRWKYKGMGQAIAAGLAGKDVSGTHYGDRAYSLGHLKKPAPKAKATPKPASAKPASAKPASAKPTSAKPASAKPTPTTRPEPARPTAPKPARPQGKRGASPESRVDRFGLDTVTAKPAAKPAPAPARTRAPLAPKSPKEMFDAKLAKARETGSKRKQERGIRLKSDDPRSQPEYGRTRKTPEQKRKAAVQQHGHERRQSTAARFAKFDDAGTWEQTDIGTMGRLAGWKTKEQRAADKAMVRKQLTNPNMSPGMKQALRSKFGEEGGIYSGARGSDDAKKQQKALDDTKEKMDKYGLERGGEMTKQIAAQIHTPEERAAHRAKQAKKTPGKTRRRRRRRRR